jgi:hypothetical protein
MDFATHVSPSVQWIIVRLNSSAMTLEDIAKYTDLSVPTVKQILAYYDENRCVYCPPPPVIQVYRPLSYFDIGVCGSIF